MPAYFLIPLLFDAVGVEQNAISVLLLLAPITGAVLMPYLMLRQIKCLTSKSRTAHLMCCPNCASRYESGLSKSIQCTSCNHKFDVRSSLLQWRRAILSFGSKQSGPQPRGTRTLPWWIFPVMLPVSLGFLLLIAWAEYSLDLGLPVTWFAWLPLVLYGIVTILFFKKLRSAKRFGILASKHDFLLCESCSYPLQCMSCESVCPECGSPYERDDLRRRWYELFGSYNLDEAMKFDVPLVVDRESP